MSLPKAVQAIGEAAEAAAVEAGIKQGDKPLTRLVESPPLEIAPVNDPAPAKKVDPEDYKERFSRYKTSTDQTISELRTNLTQAQQTIAEVQKQNQELISQVTNLVATSQTSSPAAEKSADDAAYKAWLDKIPQRVKDEYTEDYLKDQYAIHKASAPEAPKVDDSKYKDLESKVDNVAQFQKKTLAELYEDEMDRAYPNDAWISLTQEPRWAEFCRKKVSDFDTKTYGDVVKSASDSLSAKTVIRVLQQYQNELNTANPELADPLLGQLTPEGGSGSSDPVRESNAQTETITLSQVNQFFKDRATSDKYSAEEAIDIENRIKAAQAAGKIIQG